MSEHDKGAATHFQALAPNSEVPDDVEPRLHGTCDSGSDLSATKFEGVEVSQRPDVLPGELVRASAVKAEIKAVSGEMNTETRIREFLSVGEIAELVGCKPARIRYLYRAGLLTLWKAFIDFEETSISIHDELVVTTSNGVRKVKFSTDLLNDPKFFINCTNSMDSRRWGEGWTGLRDSRARFPGVIDPERIKVINAGGRVPTQMNKILPRSVHRRNQPFRLVK